jgi:hypothetical protein
MEVKDAPARNNRDWIGGDPFAGIPGIGSA